MTGVRSLLGQIVLARRSAATGAAVQGALDSTIGPADPAAGLRDRVPLGPVLLKPDGRRRPVSPFVGPSPS
ncbi:MAG: hypothetical protein ABWZ76_08025 [Acidimicrobiales bacterium]